MRELLGTIFAIIFLVLIVFAPASFFVGLMNGDGFYGCEYKNRLSKHNPFYRAGCVLTEPIYTDNLSKRIKFTSLNSG